MSSVKVVETPMVDAKADEFINDVVRGDAYSKSKYFGEFGTNILSAYAGSKGLNALGRLPIVIRAAKYMTGRFFVGAKTMESVTKHLQSIGEFEEAGNKIMMDRMKKIVDGTLKATKEDIGFAKHELREGELYKGGKSGMTLEEAHHATLKEQGQYHPGSETKRYTQEALDASNAEWIKELDKK